VTDTPPPPEPREDPLDATDAGDKVIRGSGLRAAGHIIGLLTGIISAPLVVRHLGTVGYGQFATVQSLIVVVTALIEGGLANVAVRSYATSDDAARRTLIANLLGLRLVMVTVGVLLAIGYALAAGFESKLVVGTAIAGVTLMITAYQHASATPLTAELRLHQVAIVDLTRTVLTGVFQVTLVLVGATLLPFFAVAGLASLASLALTFRWVRSSVSLVPAFDGEEWVKLLRETGAYAVATVLGAVYFQVALQAVKLLSTDVEVGHYAVAFRIVDLANGLPWLLAGSGFPVLARAATTDPARLRYALGRMVEGALIVGCGLALIIGLGAQVGIDIVGGADAQPSVAVLRIVAIGVPFTYLVASWSFALLALEARSRILLCNTVAFVSALVLSLVLIPDHGARGGAVTTAALELVLALGYGFMLARLRPGLLPAPRFLIRLLAATVLSLGAGLLLIGISPVLATAAASVLYAGILAALGAIPPEIREALRRGPRAIAS
jgi:O-antigen/teichoic acid export membrane protein